MTEPRPDGTHEVVLFLATSPALPDPPRTEAGSVSGMPLDRDAARLLGALYDEHASAIFRALRRWGVPDAAADDALQETFLIASRKLHGFEGRSTHRTWLFGIALRVARGTRRARTLEPLADEPAGEGTAIDDRVDAIRAARQIDRLLGELEESQREVFVLAELHELTAPEIAEITGAKLNTVYSRLRLARERMQAGLARLERGAVTT